MTFNFDRLLSTILSGRPALGRADFGKGLIVGLVIAFLTKGLTELCRHGPSFGCSGLAVIGLDRGMQVWPSGKGAMICKCSMAASLVL